MITTKWPGLIVVGSDISKELALEINIRTAHFPLSTNDHQYNVKLMSYILKRPIPYSEWGSYYDLSEEISKIVKSINVHYFRNEWLASCYIGGPHGWCNPNGKLFSNNYNIGKWPSNEDVESELKLIAETWKQLQFTVQLLNNEYCCDDGELIVTDQYEIDNGKVSKVEPSSRKDNVEVVTNDYSIFSHGETFLTLNDVKETIDRLRNS